MDGWSDAEWLTLQLGPVWVISALIGRNRFDELEQEAFWQAVADAPQGPSALSWQLVQAMSRNREWLFDEFLLDDRSIVSGLGQVTGVLETWRPRSAERLARPSSGWVPVWLGRAARSGGG